MHFRVLWDSLIVCSENIVICLQQQLCNVHADYQITGFSFFTLLTDLSFKGVHAFVIPTVAYMYLKDMFVFCLFK